MEHIYVVIVSAFMSYIQFSGLLVKPGTPEQRNTGTPEHRNSIIPEHGTPEH